MFRNIVSKAGCLDFCLLLLATFLPIKSLHVSGIKLRPQYLKNKYIMINIIILLTTILLYVFGYDLVFPMVIEKYNLKFVFAALLY